MQPLIDAQHLCQRECEGCPFTGPKVGSKGNPEAKIVFVAESPGYQEVRTRIPLTGPSGRIFHEFVPNDDSIYILNALECCPPSKLKGEQRMNTATLACHDRLIERIQAHPRRIIVGMGNPAMRSLTGDMSIKITKIRGRLVESPYAELGIMPVVHIAALMRGTGSFRQWKEDINYALELGAGGNPRDHLKAEVQVVPVTPGDPVQTQCHVDEIMEVLTSSQQYPHLTADIETTGLQYYDRPQWTVTKNSKTIHTPQPAGRILSIGITPEHDKSISYCFWPAHLPYLKRYLESHQIRWAWHNGKFDVKFLRAVGINARVDDDTMLMSYTLDESGGVHDLEQVSGDVLDAPDYKYMIQPYLPNKDSSYELIPPSVLAEYQAIDTSNTAQLRPALKQRITRDTKLDALYHDTLIPASEMLAWVEMNGIAVDEERIAENEDFFSDMKAHTREELCDLIGGNINPGSYKQIGRLLYRHLKFPNKHKGSTEKGILENLREMCKPDDIRIEIITKILEYRKAAKMHGTYVKGLRKWISSDGRIHSNYKIHGTRTGRLSSAEPNMQNPPRLPQIRGSFVAAEGYELVEVDLSQAELRSLAAVSGDPVLCDIYNTEGDLHDDLAIYLFPGWDERRREAKGTDLFQQAYEERVKCKNVNFGIVYGITAFGLYDQIGGLLTRCAEMIDGWFIRYNVAGKFIGKCRRAPTSNQVITTCFGRKKRVGLVSRSNLKHLQNEAANFPHQSIASDITLMTAIFVWRLLRLWGVKIVNLVHDSIIMEVPILADGGELRERVINLVSNTLAQVPKDYGLVRVPFKSDAEVGHRWGSLSKYPELKEAA